jgi:hypothetical protein
MRITKLLAAQLIPELRPVSLAEFREILVAAKAQSRESVVRSSGWIFVGALVLPFLLLIALPAYLLVKSGISVAWIVIMVPVAVLASAALSEIATLWLIYPELGRQARLRPAPGR